MESALDSKVIIDALVCSRPMFEFVLTELETIAAGLDMATNRLAIFTYEGVTNPDFKITGFVHSDGAIGVAGNVTVKYNISGPYGSHIDGDLIAVERDVVKDLVQVYPDGITAYTTIIKLALFMGEVETYFTGRGTLPDNNLFLPK